MKIVAFKNLALVAALCLPLAGLAAAPAPTLPDAPTSVAPNVPPPSGNRGPQTFKLVLTVQEKNIVLAKGFEKDTLYPAWTFNGTVPGPFIRVKVGDTLELHLVNPASSKMAHNIDLHAVSGPGGGSVLTLAAPGQEKVARFKLLNPGLYIYHCAAPPVAWHIANGMYGMILVDPKEGLPAVDKEFCVVQGEFYTKKPFGSEGLQAFDYKALDREQPTYVVFNGAVDSMSQDHPLQAKVGDRVRVYFGNAGPNLISSFHIIGTIFDTVWNEGSTSSPLENIGVVLVPAAGTAIVDFVPKEPGNYTLVDHSISRVQKGTLGILHVEGAADPSIYEAVTEEK